MNVMTIRESGLSQQVQKPHILVVDDDEVNGDMLARILTPTYRVTCVEDGGDALAVLEKTAVDTVLLDIMLPGISGYEILQSIRQNPKTADIPVILISALNDASDVVRGLEEGANDYLSKPSPISVVRARVQTQVNFKRLMDEHKQVIEQLQEAQKMRDRLFSMASHDLKSPLSNIRMAEYLLRDLVQDNPIGQRVLNTIVSTVGNMQQVIEEFLDVAAFQSGKISLNLTSIPIEKAVIEVVMEYAIAAANKDIRIELGSLHGEVLADAPRLRQILNNLISNAIKYSPPDSPVWIWSETGDGCVRINIADHGKGIPAEEKHLLFQEFSKLSTRPTADESSTGLGLWIVKHLVSLHNGEVGVDCPPDGGSIFWFTLPSSRA